MFFSAGRTESTSAGHWTLFMNLSCEKEGGSDNGMLMPLRPLLRSLVETTFPWDAEHEKPDQRGR
jgi:hypothetical protein